MRLTKVQVGPLATSGATKIGLSQKPNGAFALALDGTTATGYSATNIANTQAGTGGGSFTLNGTLAVGSPAVAQIGGKAVVILSSGNDSGITFTVKGTQSVGSGLGGVAYAQETVSGTNASRTVTRTKFLTVTAITMSSAAAANVSAGTNGTVALDTPRRVLFTPGGNDATVTWTVFGTDWNGEIISEIVTGVANPTTVYTNYDFATISAIWASAASASTLTVGTNGVASSRPIFLDRYALAPTSLEVDVTGTVNYTVQQSLNDPNDVGYTSVNWVSHPDPAFVNSTATAQSEYGYIPTVTRILLNSETAGTGHQVVYYVLQASGTVM